ncbi:hypothetical protein PR048_015249 [Dryococelus australis]|uniref:Uncharacterized protein n=1 Tax=Dryococelus australis TaxID=614101 RepID=A0ABQ9HGE6_9NEOP|nr:hypothetical protein PR048_015249 [Dryococelus australis]
MAAKRCNHLYNKHREVLCLPASTNLACCRGQPTNSSRALLEIPNVPVRINIGQHGHPECDDTAVSDSSLPAFRETLATTKFHPFEPLLCSSLQWWLAKVTGSLTRRIHWTWLEPKNMLCCSENYVDSYTEGPRIHFAALTSFDSRHRNRIRLERASQKQSSDTHKTPYDRVKHCRERNINIKASERVNVAVFTQNKQQCPQQSHTPFFLDTRSGVRPAKLVTGEECHFHISTGDKNVDAHVSVAPMILGSQTCKIPSTRQGPLRSGALEQRMPQPQQRSANYRAHYRRMAKLLASHPCELGLIPGRAASGFPHVEIVPDDAIGRWVFSGISRFTRPFRRCSILIPITLIGSQHLAVKSHLKSLHSCLVNGATGALKIIDWPVLRRDQLEHVELPSAVHIKFDDPTIRPDNSEDSTIKIEPTSTEFDGLREAERF